MFSIKSLVNKITDKGSGTGREVTGESSASFVDTEEQHSAEGFLCPQCMRAFPSAETLEEHYNKSHSDAGASSSQSNGDIQDLRQEILNLQSSLADERTTSEELKREVLKMQMDFHSRDDDSVSSRSQEKELEEAKSFLTSEVTLLRMQLEDSLEQVSQLKKEKDILSQKILSLATDNDSIKLDVTSLETQLAHRNSIDDAAVLRQELVRVQRMMDQLALEKQKEIEDMHEKLIALESKVVEKAEEEEKTSKAAESVVNYILIEENLRAENKSLAQEVEKLRNSAASDAEEKSKQLESLKTELSDIDRKREAAELDCSALKDEVQRLTEQHSELYGKIEAGEGAKAALTALQKENEFIKQTVDTVQNQNREMSKNLHNLKIEVEKSQSEHKKLTEAHAAEAGEWEAKRLLFKEQLQFKEAEMQHAIKKHDELQRAIQAKDSEIKSTKSQLMKENENLLKLKKELETSKANEVELQKIISEQKLQINKISEDLNAKSEAITELNISKDEICAKLQSTETAFNATSGKLKKAEAEHQSLQSKLTTFEKSFAEEVKKLNIQIESQHQTLQAANNANLKVQQELEKLKELSSSEKSKYDEEISKVKTTLHEITSKNEGLQQKIEDMSSHCSAADGKVQVLRVQTDEILAEKIEVEKRLKSSEEEKSLLLERCLTGENESERLMETIGELRRKQDDALAALQELGRENQSLQMESAKLQGRKWADDSVVNTCSTCSKEFTLTIRKHHCRHCGQIYCNDCSCRTASVPSSKKPVRVCDACFTELTTK